jgi:hypothetical protein
VLVLRLELPIWKRKDRMSGTPRIKREAREELKIEGDADLLRCDYLPLGCSIITDVFIGRLEHDHR